MFSSRTNTGSPPPPSDRFTSSPTLYEELIEISQAEFETAAIPYRKPGRSNDAHRLVGVLSAPAQWSWKTCLLIPIALWVLLGCYEAISGVVCVCRWVRSEASTGFYESGLHLEGMLGVG